MHYLYILKSKRNSRFYIGCTKNLEKRLKKHNYGEVRSTEPYLPWELVYSEKYGSLKAANSREYQLKSWKSRKAIEKIIENS